MADSAAAYCCGGLLFLVIIVLFAVSMRTSRRTRRYCQSCNTETGEGNCWCDEVNKKEKCIKWTKPLNSEAEYAEVGLI